MELERLTSQFPRSQKIAQVLEQSVAVFELVVGFAQDVSGCEKQLARVISYDSVGPLEVRLLLTLCEVPL